MKSLWKSGITSNKIYPCKLEELVLLFYVSWYLKNYFCWHAFSCIYKLKRVMPDQPRIIICLNSRKILMNTLVNIIFYSQRNEDYFYVIIYFISIFESILLRLLNLFLSSFHVTWREKDVMLCHSAISLRRWVNIFYEGISIVQN